MLLEARTRDATKYGVPATVRERLARPGMEKVTRNGGSVDSKHWLRETRGDKNTFYNFADQILIRV